VAERGGRYLLVQRGAGQWFPGLWDFPSELGGVKEPVRVLSVKSESQKGMVAKHTITHHKIQLQPVRLTVSQALAASVGSEARWLTLDEMLGGDVALATTAKKVLRLLGAAK
jgi:adenine-specific DNA glycosylase